VLTFNHLERHVSVRETTVKRVTATHRTRYPMATNTSPFNVLRSSFVLGLGLLVSGQAAAQTPAATAGASVTLPEAPAAPAAEVSPTPEAATPPTELPPADPMPVDAAPVPDPAAEPAVTPPKPPPYSLPWGLRPALAVNVVRLDSALSFYKNPVTKDSGNTFVSTLLASYKVTDNISPLIRIGMASNSPADGPMGVNPGAGTVFLNPVLGINYSHKVESFRFTPFLGVALPIGSGGGNNPEPKNAAARTDGIFARSAMDNAMFAVNDLVIFPGLAVSYINHGLTFQLEATILKLTQVRGDEAAQPDKSRTNFTGGAHLGYFIIPQLSFGVEIRHQRWLSTPAAVKAAPKARDNTTFAFGPRVHLKLGETMWLRPGISFSTPLDDPMADREQKTIQLDIPFLF
jgi:hypothetical protein